MQKKWFRFIWRYFSLSTLKGKPKKTQVIICNTLLIEYILKHIGEPYDTSRTTVVIALGPKVWESAKYIFSGGWDWAPGPYKNRTIGLLELEERW